MHDGRLFETSSGSRPTVRRESAKSTDRAAANSYHRAVLDGSILVVDRDAQDRAALEQLFGESGVRARSAADVEAAGALFDAEPFDLVLLELGTEANHAELADALKRFAGASVIALGTGGVRRALDTVRSGAADFIEKPWTFAEVQHVVGKVLAAHLAEAAPPLCATPETGLFGESKAMGRVAEVIRRVAAGMATVLVRGETGTGKELVARAVHALSQRSSAPFVKVHCAALPDALLESEIFGYEKGAFTGASARKPGRVDIAEGGTLFLDEIGDITPAMQVKLLRLLQDREYERLGGAATLRANVRFIAATHRDLEHMMKRGEFREDLFYRLNVVPIWLPPLRARREDIEALARHFCRVFAEAHAKRGTHLSDEALAALRSERWPGNVRQLQNFVERLVVLTAADSVLDASDVQRELSPAMVFPTQSAGDGAALAPRPEDANASVSQVVSLDAALRDAERRAIERALRHAGSNRTLAARLLGVSRACLYNKLEEHGFPKQISRG